MGKFFLNGWTSQSGWLKDAILQCPFSLLAFAFINLMGVLLAARYEDCGYWFLPALLPFALIFSLLLLLFEKNIDLLHYRIVKRFGRLHAVFLLFFAYLIFFLLAAFLLIVYPSGVILRQFSSVVTAADFSRWTLNGAIIFAIFLWLRFAVMRIIFR